MSDIAAWLLEQIGEDERPTYELLPFQCEPGCCAPAGWVGHRCLICGTTEYGGTVEAIDAIAQEHAATIHARARVLAECKVKRRIVEEVVPVVDGLDGAVQNEFWISSDGPYDYTSDLLLRLLASVYADRPGYDESWRP